jgi:hypothetical protein
MKITLEQFIVFEKRYLFAAIKNPDFRLGQAFIDEHRDIGNSIMGDEKGIFKINRLWLAKSREEVLELLDGYIIK